MACVHGMCELQSLTPSYALTLGSFPSHSASGIVGILRYSFMGYLQFEKNVGLQLYHVRIF